MHNCLALLEKDSHQFIFFFLRGSLAIHILILNVISALLVDIHPNQNSSIRETQFLHGTLIFHNSLTNHTSTQPIYLPKLKKKLNKAKRDHVPPTDLLKQVPPITPTSKDLILHDYFNDVIVSLDSQTTDKEHKVASR